MNWLLYLKKTSAFFILCLPLLGTLALAAAALFCLVTIFLADWLVGLAHLLEPEHGAHRTSL